MKLHFDELFLHSEDQVTPKFDIKSNGIFHKKGLSFSDCITVFGVSYAALSNHDFELASLPEGGYEIKAYYVR